VSDLVLEEVGEHSIHRHYAASILLPSGRAVRSVGVTVAGRGVGDLQVEVTVSNAVETVAMLTMSEARRLGSALVGVVRRYG
jgi:hypothetical protein